MVLLLLETLEFISVFLRSMAYKISTIIKVAKLETRLTSKFQL